MDTAVDIACLWLPKNFNWHFTSHVLPNTHVKNYREILLTCAKLNPDKRITLYTSYVKCSAYQIAKLNELCKPYSNVRVVDLNKKFFGKFDELRISTRSLEFDSFSEYLRYRDERTIPFKLEIEICKLIILLSSKNSTIFYDISLLPQYHVADLNIENEHNILFSQCGYILKPWIIAVTGGPDNAFLTKIFTYIKSQNLNCLHGDFVYCLYMYALIDENFQALEYKAVPYFLDMPHKENFREKIIDSKKYTYADGTDLIFDSKFEATSSEDGDLYQIELDERKEYKSYATIDLKAKLKAELIKSAFPYQSVLWGSCSNYLDAKKFGNAIKRIFGYIAKSPLTNNHTKFILQRHLEEIFFQLDQEYLKLQLTILDLLLELNVYNRTPYYIIYMLSHLPKEQSTHNGLAMTKLSKLLFGKWKLPVIPELIFSALNFCDKGMTNEQISQLTAVLLEENVSLQTLENMLHILTDEYVDTTK